MFAHYVVAKINGVVTPFIIFPGDNLGLERPLINRDKFDYKTDVISAGFLTWEGGSDDVVKCFGQGDVPVQTYPLKLATYKSRGKLDAKLFRDLLSQPIGYILMGIGGQLRPVFLYPGDTHDYHLLARYQRRPKEVVISAGWMDFGLATGAAPSCYGEAVFDKNDKARVDISVTKQSRGDADLKLFKKYYTQ